MTITRKAILITALVAAPVWADWTNTLKWTHPTEREDKTPLPATEIKGYEIRYGAFPEAQKWKLIRTVGKVTTLTLTVTEPGRYCYQARTVDTGDRESAWSPQACIDIPKLLVKPGAPRIEVSVKINPVAKP